MITIVTLPFRTTWLHQPKGVFAYLNGISVGTGCNYGAYFFLSFFKRKIKLVILKGEPENGGG
jgi:hypothetical protein